LACRPADVYAKPYCVSDFQSQALFKDPVHDRTAALIARRYDLSASPIGPVPNDGRGYIDTHTLGRSLVAVPISDEKVEPMRHVPQLDGIRAVAVLIVVISHAGLGWLVPGGFGVTIFFFLSGYLITSLMRSEASASGKVDLGAFYLRRTLRIMPPLYITLALLTAANSFGLFGNRVNNEAIPWDYLFLSNYSHIWGQEGGLPVPLWSLAVEEHFYIVFPITFIVFLISRGSEKAAKFCFFTCIAILAMRFITMIEPTSIFRNYYWSHTRLDSILFGCCLALWQNPIMDKGAWKPNHWQAAMATCFILSTFVIPADLFRQTIRYSIQGAGLFVLFSYVLSNRAPLLVSVLSWKPVAWIGLISYTLYLCHFAIFAALEHLGGSSKLIVGISGILLAVAFSWAMRVAVEKPILAWRRSNSRKVKSLVQAS